MCGVPGTLADAQRAFNHTNEPVGMLDIQLNICETEMEM